MVADVRISLGLLTLSLSALSDHGQRAHGPFVSEPTRTILSDCRIKAWGAMGRANQGTVVTFSDRGGLKKIPRSSFADGVNVCNGRRARRQQARERISGGLTHSSNAIRPQLERCKAPAIDRVPLLTMFFRQRPLIPSPEHHNTLPDDRILHVQLSSCLQAHSPILQAEKGRVIISRKELAYDFEQRRSK
jgi:hypothetical protein